MAVFEKAILRDSELVAAEGPPLPALPPPPAVAALPPYPPQPVLPPRPGMPLNQNLAGEEAGEEDTAALKDEANVYTI